MTWLTFLLFRVEAQAGCKVVANTIILALKNVNLSSLFFRKEMYTQNISGGSIYCQIVGSLFCQNH